MTYYLRHKVGEDRRSPLGRFTTIWDGPGICEQCCNPLTGSAIALFAVGPADREEALKADSGEHYNAYALPVHEACAYPDGLEPDDLLDAGHAPPNLL